MAENDTKGPEAEDKAPRAKVRDDLSLHELNTHTFKHDAKRNDQVASLKAQVAKALDDTFGPRVNRR